MNFRRFKRNHPRYLAFFKVFLASGCWNCDHYGGCSPAADIRPVHNDHHCMFFDRYVDGNLVRGVINKRVHKFYHDARKQAGFLDRIIKKKLCVCRYLWNQAKRPKVCTGMLRIRELVINLTVIKIGARTQYRIEDFLDGKKPELGKNRQIFL